MAVKRRFSKSVDLSYNHGSGSVGPSHQTVSGASKNWYCLPFFTQVFHSSCCGACRVVQQRFCVKELDILGVEACCDPPTYFQEGSGPPTPMVSFIYQFDAPMRFSLARCPFAFKHARHRVLRQSTASPRKVWYANHFSKCADAVCQKLSKLVSVYQNCTACQIWHVLCDTVYSLIY